MTLGQIATAIAIITGLATALTFIINKIVVKTKHEVVQDDKLNLLVKQREECFIEREKQCDSIVCRIEKLEKQDNDRELTIISIKEKMEALLQAHDHTQLMILQLTNNQNETFSKLIKTIGDLANGQTKVVSID